MKIAVVTDSTAYLTPEQYQETGVRKVPLSVIMEGKAYKEEVDLTTTEFFEKVDRMQNLPTSSQPTVGDFFTVYEELAEEGYDAILSIHISRKISGTYQNASSVANSFEQAKVYTYDSEITSAGQAMLVLEAVKLVKQGLSPEEIIEKLDQLKKTIKLFFIVDDLTNLVKGGRLSTAAGALGTLLKIKPVLTMNDGEIGVYDKIRTQKKALLKIEEVLKTELEQKDYPLQATILHGDAPEKGEKWKRELEEKFPAVDFSISHLGPVIGVHTGRGALGIIWSQKTSS